MFASRIIPCILLNGNSVIKTRQFKDPVYIGDPVNTIRIFSDKEVDELIIIDKGASTYRYDPNYDLLSRMAGEAFMPLSYGGGISNLEQIRKIIRSGIEKVVINTAATTSTELIKAAVREFGSQAIVGAVDIKRNWLGRYRVVSCSATINTSLDLLEHTKQLIGSGIGELFVSDVDRDGSMIGYDLDLIRYLSGLEVPLVICGGAGNVQHLRDAIQLGGASAAAGGSMFVFHGKRRAVLISYPELEICAPGAR